ncbi:tRNA (adenosine(37)-N6)-dimethylallyltransferase MiaA [Caldibacillus lycopersici]|uniref:tRNA dimethylallyltransferase n=1 Tax=Perspicuibacillus lycopersici TaxID=1325689 RepID=A0AAE3IRB4_9BACI|nr:tRNA (adenosine(37)-N6)-dimethylallyltransferase MiaA [Perspicuibacillus lycopersici]MCU9611976.1 tRNA (adenosine(37)-N6)-dimethylallyltransferase MiaA [Perspicuibacillus lycopersici]
MSNKEKLLVLIGPTSVGKTKMSIDLAKKFNGEIISGDSMQIYRGMDIGTAKITEEEMGGIPHHLIDIKNPDESFSVAEFQQLVRKKITEITNRKRLPMIVGGTGLYIQSVIYDYQFSEVPGDEKIRQQLTESAEKEGIEKLYGQLQVIDPKAAAKIHPNNERRVIRALEVYVTTGKTMTEYEESQKKELLYDVVLIGLTMDRELLYQRINDRVDIMMQRGLLNEVRTLHASGLQNVQSLQAIGYKELLEYLDGHVSLEEAIANLKQNTRRFAKRQFTWFKNKMDIMWFDLTDERQYEKIFEEISYVIAGKLEIKANT